MQMWEYKGKLLRRPKEDIPIRADETAEFLKSEGEEGWELVAVVGDEAFFKRPIEDG